MSSIANRISYKQPETYCEMTLIYFNKVLGYQIFEDRASRKMPKTFKDNDKARERRELDKEMRQNKGVYVG